MLERRNRGGTLQSVHMLIEPQVCLTSLKTWWKWQSNHWTHTHTQNALQTLNLSVEFHYVGTWISLWVSVATWQQRTKWPSCQWRFFLVDDVLMKETHFHKYWTHEEAPNEITAPALCGKLRSTICNQEDGRLQLAQCYHSSPIVSTYLFWPASSSWVGRAADGGSVDWANGKAAVH